MIKLASIIKEIKTDVEWRAPDNTPDEVVDVLHLLIAVITSKGEDYREYIHLMHPTAHEWGIQHGIREDFILMFDTSDKTWFYSVDDVFIPIANKKMLVHLIKNWI